MKTFLAALLVAATTIPASAHSAKLRYLTKPTDDIVIRVGDKPKPSGQVVVLTDGRQQRFNVHHMHNIYVVCRHGVEEFDNKPCKMVVIIGDEIIEEINGQPVVHRTKGQPWRF